MKPAEHPDGTLRVVDILQSTFFWFAMVALIAGFVFLVIFINAEASASAMSASRRSVPRSACSNGEVYDPLTKLCAPIFHAPLAFEPSIMDNSRTACDSFFDSMCGTWMQQHTNENRAFTYGYKRNQAVVERLIAGSLPVGSADGQTASTIGDFYYSCMHRKTNPKESALEFKHIYAHITEGLRTHADLPTVFGRLARLGYSIPWSVSIERHPTEPRMIPLITFDSLPRELNEQKLYLMINAVRQVAGFNILDIQSRIEGALRIMRELRTRNTRPLDAITDYKDYIAHQFANDVVRFDTLPQQWPLRGYQPVRGWYSFFTALDGQGLRFHHDQEVWVIDKPYLDWLFTIGLKQFEIGDWRAYIDFSIIYNLHNFEPELPSNVYFKQNDQRGPLGKDGRIYARIPRDVSSPPTGKRTAPALENSTTCVRQTQYMLPGMVAKAFLKHAFPDREQVRAEIFGMVDTLRNTLVDTLNTTTPWLSPADRGVLIRKLQATIIRVMEPDEWDDEPFAGRISKDRYEHNLNLIRRYRVERNLAMWHKDKPTGLDRSAIAFFGMPLTEVNAYYSGTTNTITILAGILQEPFYNRQYNHVSKWAIIGTIISHEMTHMIDHHGLYYGPNGSLHLDGILSPEGMRAFYNASDCVVVEYGPAPNGCEDSNVHYGNSTVTENLSDLTGVSLALKAAGLTTMADRQHFFMILAQAFCASYDQAHMCEAVEHDVHSIPVYRINRTFRNIPEFRTAFGCFSGQGMYKAPETECKVY